MGDVLGGVFGSGQRTTSETEPDETSQALNELRLRELTNLFSQYGISQFAQPGGEAYAASPKVDELFKTATASQPFDDLIPFD